ncbi:hypothetical protein HNO88_002341 [Novosphingobium chloroacetimidivorans]|uniref:Uncharacterized protein n=1 Tax=Novosphingobium chloroacetimidivorans TaxID=1428314 RepID=A0A7W7KA55_9SPHN|nr:hypothetical protein [Novosphingobium chloroacetimidivorans]MBB4859015.1 hypothetical protein [Novosphingobium chloroacetimidivorans]
MANRLFLTLLALLTGLAAQLAPAQARGCAPQTAAVAIVAPAAVRAPAAPVELARLPEPGRRHARMVADDEGAEHAPTLAFVGVRIGIDRARE